MRLPYAENVQLPPGKLNEYALNPNHPVGTNKARVFKAALGFVQNDSEILWLLIKNLVRFFEAEQRETDEFGTRYEVDIRLTGRTVTAIVRTGWILPRESGAPHLTTAYVLTDDNTEAP
jgi:hypothetical protein